MKKVLLIVNPISGGKDKAPIVKDVLKTIDSTRFSTEVVHTEYAGHASKLAAESDADIVVAVGGDGTQNEVARAIAGTSKTLAIIPCGSGDGLALHLGISRRPAKAAGTICSGSVVNADYGIFESHPFFCTCGVGLDAMVGWRFAQSGSRGLVSYIKSTIKTWFPFKPERYRVSVDGKLIWDAPASMITVGNANQWGNRAYITPHASVCDGELDITIVGPFRVWAFPGLLWHMMAGSADKSRHARCFRGKSITIERENEGPAHFDGDPIIMGRSMEISLVPRVLKILVPKGRENKI